MGRDKEGRERVSGISCFLISFSHLLFSFVSFPLSFDSLSSSFAIPVLFCLNPPFFSLLPLRLLIQLSSLPLVIITFPSLIFLSAFLSFLKFVLQVFYFLIPSHPRMFVTQVFSLSLPSPPFLYLLFNSFFFLLPYLLPLSSLCYSPFLFLIISLSLLHNQLFPPYSPSFLPLPPLCYSLPLFLFLITTLFLLIFSSS